MIPISSVDVPEAARDLVMDVLISGQLAQGPRVAELEELAADMAGVRHALAVNNGTTALVLALEALALEPGDEVVTSPFTFAATLNAILEAGAVARFADIGDDYNVDPAALADAIGPRTKVLLPVHLYGLPADMDAITELARDRGLFVVEDAAQAHGATVDGRPVGGSGIGCFSLYGTKNVTTGEGGLVTCNDDDLVDRMRLLRNQGMRQRYQYEVPGHNYRLTDLQAAVGIPQLRSLDEIIDRRRENARFLLEELADVAGIALPVVPPGRGHVWHQFTIRLTADAPVGRDEFVERMADQRIGTGIYYPRTVFDYECYRNHPRVVVSDVPRAEAAARGVVSLPVHPRLSRDQLAEVVRGVRSAVS